MTRLDFMIVTALIAVGFVDTHGFLDGVIRSEVLRDIGRVFWFSLPVLPLLIALLNYRRRILVPKWATWTVTALVFAVGAMSTLLAVIGGIISMAYVGALSCAIAAMILSLSRTDPKIPLRSWPSLLLIIPSLVAIWSISVVPIISYHAIKHAKTAPYCLALHRPSMEVGSYADLRGLHFYTTNGGYKLGDHWFFHGLLLVDRDDAHREAYNWSPRRLRLDPVNLSKRWHANPSNLCTPRLGFLGDLPFI